MKTLVINLIIVLSMGCANATGANLFSINDTLTTLDDSLCLCDVKPIDLFVTNNENESVTLSWSNDQQTTNDTFLVQNSYDGKVFYDVGITHHSLSKNNQEVYELIDRSPASGENYYRLVYHNHNGQLTYSKIRKIEITKRMPIVMENPITNELNLKNLKEGDRLYFYDSNGLLIFEDVFYQNYSRNMSDCHDGLYIISIVNTEDEFSQTQRLLVTK